MVSKFTVLSIVFFLVCCLLYTNAKSVPAEVSVGKERRAEKQQKQKARQHGSRRTADLQRKEELGRKAQQSFLTRRMEAVNKQEATVARQVIPEDWNCADSFFDTNDGCHCGCGAPDPDCELEETPEALGCPDDRGTTYSCQEGLCVDDNIPFFWNCPNIHYNVGDGCHCGCGAPDPDCEFEETPEALGCPDTGATYECKRGICRDIEIPDSWFCSFSFYNTRDGCDCECGAPDPDCEQDDQEIFNCPGTDGFNYTCPSDTCEVLIAPAKSMVNILVVLGGISGGMVVSCFLFYVIAVLIHRRDALAYEREHAKDKDIRMPVNDVPMIREEAPRQQQKAPVQHARQESPTLLEKEKAVSSEAVPF